MSKYDLSEEEIKELQYEVNIVKEFAEKLEKNTKHIPPEFAELIDAHFWELI